MRAEVEADKMFLEIYLQAEPVEADEVAEIILQQALEQGQQILAAEAVQAGLEFPVQVALVL